MEVYGKYFCGNEVSEYGQENGYVDYATFAKAFDAVLANDLMELTREIGFWGPETSDTYYEDTDGNIYTEDERDEKLEELEEQRNTLEDDILAIEDKLSEMEDTETEIYKALEADLVGTQEAYDEVTENIDALDNEHYHEVYQWYIVSDEGARLCREANEILYYNEVLDLYLWGVTHYGTSWNYVLTNIRCNTREN